VLQIAHAFEGPGRGLGGAAEIEKNKTTTWKIDEKRALAKKKKKGDIT